MKILGISAGRRNGTNDSMCRVALKEAKTLGAEVEFINLNDLELKNCTGCLACVNSIFSGKGNACAIKDDYMFLQDKMLGADGIIWAVPIFEKCAAGLFHTVMDRFGPRMDYVHNIIADKICEENDGKPIDKRIFNTKAVSYMAIGGSDWGTTVQNDFFTQALTQKWKIIDNEWFPWAQDAFNDSIRVEKAKEIGSNIYRACEMGVENASYKGEEGVCPHCHSRSFYINPNKSVVCSQCGIVGTLIEEDSNYKFQFEESEIEKAHDTMSGDWKHADEVKENAMKVMDLAKNQDYKNRVKELAEEFPAQKPAKIS